MVVFSSCKMGTTYREEGWEQNFHVVFHAEVPIQQGVMSYEPTVQQSKANAPHSQRGV